MDDLNGQLSFNFNPPKATKRTKGKPAAQNGMQLQSATVISLEQRRMARYNNELSARYREILKLAAHIG
ncbi:hypothetical protein [Methylosinus sporium]|uniref:hypothetical protein n=1 Tax=Methylosinus sporium TaxID=428 RepID=UPI00383A14B7